MVNIVLYQSLASTAAAHDKLLRVPDDPGRINEYTDLIPIDQLPEVIAELKTALQSTTPERGTKWAEYLIGCYPNFKPHNVAVYSRAISSVFAKNLDDLCKAAVEKISLENQFPPNRAEVHAVLETLRRARARKLDIARAMKEEHGNKSLLQVLMEEKSI